MDIGKSFTYMMEDQNWIMKILIGGIVSLIPIVNFAAIGYMLTTLKNVADGQPQPLPEWGDFGAHFMKGLYAFVGILIYLAPIFLIYCCMAVLSTGLAAMAPSSGNDSGGAIGSVIGLVSACLGCLIFLYAIVVAVTLPAALTRFAVSANQLSVFWDFSGNLALIRNNLSNYIIAILIGWVASFVAGFGVILCVIGVFFTSFWAQLVTAHVYGSFWRNTQGTAGVPAPTTLS